VGLAPQGRQAARRATTVLASRRSSGDAGRKLVEGVECARASGHGVELRDLRLPDENALPEEATAPRGFNEACGDRGPLRSLWRSA
jgi:hypothetical protein